jgi:hypothetical protein
MSRTSRRTQRRGISGGASTVFGVPLRVNSMDMCVLLGESMRVGSAAA